MNSNKIHSVWPIFIGEFHNPKHQELKGELINFFQEYENKNKTSREGEENLNLYESGYFLHKEKNNALSKIINFIAEAFLIMAKNINQKEFDNIKNENTKLTTEVMNSWFIRYNKGGMVTPHDHPGCSLSCVYYVQIGDDTAINNGSTYFLRPFIRGTSHTDFAGTRYNKGAQIFKAEEGKLLIWPSFLVHGSNPYAGKKNRIIISANSNVVIKKKL